MNQESKGGNGWGLTILGGLVGFACTGTAMGAVYGALIGGVVVPLLLIGIFLTVAMVQIYFADRPSRVRVHYQARVEVPEEKTSEELWDEQFDAYLATQGKKREDVHT